MRTAATITWLIDNFEHADIPQGVNGVYVVCHPLKELNSTGVLIVDIKPRWHVWIVLDLNQKRVQHTYIVHRLT